ncbi:hypothetical protein GGF46_004677 [Coemansia sp. RSA 552]|nr:hypothetical protein GGF46_004677 [Coemansia sp. RSA 552]
MPPHKPPNVKELPADPQVCVSAAMPNAPLNAVEQQGMQCRRPPALHHQPSVLKAHYAINKERFVEPPAHPNAGIGGIHELPHESDIGGCYGISRESETGNDHVDSGGYPLYHCIRNVIHKISHLALGHKHSDDQTSEPDHHA